MNEFTEITVATGLIKQVVARIESLEEKKTEIQTEIKETFDEAKAHGLDVQILKQLIRLRKKKKEDIEEQEELLEIYKRALEQ
ncbi:MAG: DUF2312 domain-containing protein [Holosporales bacterium]|jgi:uncharacterized protein (UPF0335 family)|nr:DUF2312 domain-containing protein [Holosporales bacterium]